MNVPITAWVSFRAALIRWICFPPPSEYLFAHHWMKKYTKKADQGITCPPASPGEKSR